jgi:hypothetical protein
MTWAGAIGENADTKTNSDPSVARVNKRSSVLAREEFSGNGRARSLAIMGIPFVAAPVFPAVLEHPCLGVVQNQLRFMVVRIDTLAASSTLHPHAGKCQEAAQVIAVAYQ